MRIAVVGATGVLGSHVVPRLLERGHWVHACVKPGGRGLSIRHPHLAVCEASVLDPASCEAPFEGADAVLHLATAIPPSGPVMDWSRNDAVRRDGTRNVLDVGRRQGIARYVFQSVGMLANDATGRLLNESSPISPSVVTASAADLEALVASAGVNAAVLRGGTFYGPGTARMHAWNQQASEGVLQYFGDGSSFMSLIHVVDMARAVVCAAESAARGIFNIVDDRPVRERELFDHLASLAGTVATGGSVRQIFPSFNLSNTVAREQLGWTPAFPSYLSGWR